jgi:hypothetical protein
MLEKFAAMQMIDVHLPTTDGFKLVLSGTREACRMNVSKCYTKPI